MRKWPLKTSVGSQMQGEKLYSPMYKHSPIEAQRQTTRPQMSHKPQEESITAAAAAETYGLVAEIFLQLDRNLFAYALAIVAVSKLVQCVSRLLVLVCCICGNIKLHNIYTVLADCNVSYALGTYASFQYWLSRYKFILSRNMDIWAGAIESIEIRVVHTNPDSN